MALLLVLMVFPRVALVLLYLSANVVQRAYDGVLAPVLGLVFLPATTTAYAWIANTHHPLSGSYLAAFVIALLIDMGAWSEATRSKSKPRGMVANPGPPLD
jgi:ACR3 family arsenite efflux pump ArsB